MKRTATAAMLILAGGLRAACQGGFIVEFDSVQNGLPAQGFSIREKPWGYLVFGQHVVDDGTGQSRCAVYKVGPEGQFLARTEWDTGSEYDFTFGFIDPIANRPDGGFMAAVDRYNGPEKAMFSYRFDSEGELIAKDTLLYPDPSDSVWMGTRATRSTSDGGIVIAGWRQIGSSYSKGLLLKVDSNSQVQWLKEFAPTQSLSLSAWGVAQYIDGGYLLTGIGLGNGNPNASFLLRTDSLGNQLWRRYYGGRSGPYGAVRVDSAGYIYTWSDYRDPSWPFNRFQAMLCKWSPSGGLVWETRTHYFVTYARDFELLPDGSFITCGAYGTYGFITKYNAEGDSLWTGWLQPFSDLAGNNVYDVQPTSDGGFALTGYTIQDSSDPHPGLQTLWAAKVDSMGCVIPGCQNVGVQEYTIDLQKYLVVSPNPASEQVSVELSLPETGEIEGQARVLLQDASGRTVLEQPVQRNMNQLRATLDVSALPAGLYYLHLRDARRWLAGSKVVVE